MYKLCDNRTMPEADANGARRSDPRPEPQVLGGNPNYVLSLARGLKVIESFDGHSDGLTIADVAARTGTSRAAARRLLLTLELLGYAEAARGAWRLKARVLKLGFSYLSSTSLITAAQKVLERVTDAVHESASMSVLDGDQIVYVARSQASRVMSVGLSVGSRLPAYCTSMGRVLLAGLPDPDLENYLRSLKAKSHTPKTIVDKTKLRKAIMQAKAAGFAIVDGELELGLRALAVPVFSRHDRVVAAINIGAHALRVDRRKMTQHFLRVLKKSAMELSNLLL